MCKAMEDMRNKAAWREKVETVLPCAEENLSHEMIARLTNLTIEQIKEIIGQRSA